MIYVGIAVIIWGIVIYHRDNKYNDSKRYLLFLCIGGLTAIVGFSNREFDFRDQCRAGDRYACDQLIARESYQTGRDVYAPATGASVPTARTRPPQPSPSTAQPLPAATTYYLPRVDPITGRYERFNSGTGQWELDLTVPPVPLPRTNPITGQFETFNPRTRQWEPL